tara:strand:- start:373 stop:1023 length:651 start_codon:yes stop_codon:yes gene_type:complete
VKRRFLVVDDHPVFRQGLVALIQSNPRYVVSADVGTSEEALAALDADQPDIALVDISLNDENGLDLVRTIRSSHPDVPVLIVSMHDESIYAERALKAGARGLVMKHEDPGEVLAAIRTVLEGRIYLSEAMRNRVLESMVASPHDTDVALEDRLSARELEVLEYIGQGYGATDIAETLTISVKTVHTYQEHLKEKLRLASTGELRRYAVSWYRASHR